MKRRIIYTLLTILGLTLLVSQVSHAYAIDPSYTPYNTPYDNVGDEVEWSKYEDIGAAWPAVVILQILAGALLYFAAPVATALIGINAFNMVIGGAESEKLEQAKKGLTWTIIGLVVIILSYSIVKIILTIIIGAASNSTDACPPDNPDCAPPPSTYIETTPQFEEKDYLLT
jgi:hypothetical protein